jgi:3-hydroxyacyl-CoA dehydrogenase
MAAPRAVNRIAIVGAGVIGSSWAALYLARGFDVIATDPAPNAETNIRRSIESAWGDLKSLGLSPGASPERFEFARDMKWALSRADFVQESGPERFDLKVRLFREMDEATPLSSIIASSSSGLAVSVMQSACRHPERCVIGHPFNPPHLIPLVEVVGGEKTSPEAIAQAMSFYAAVGKKPIHIRKELPGHVANRLQAALYREIVSLVEQDVLSVSDADAVVSWGPGLRWGVMGPNLIFHLGGGQGGIEYFMEHLAGPMTTWWSDLGHPRLTPELKQKIIDGLWQEIGNHSVEELTHQRDEMLLELLALRAKVRKAM